MNMTDMKRPTSPRARAAATLLALLACWFVCLPPASLASEKFNPVPLAVFTGTDAGPWARVERLADRHPSFVQEDFATQTQQFDPLIKRWFGDDPTPSSSEFLLHCAKGFDEKTFPNPVLLVHGAGDNANRAWVHPESPTMPATLPDKGRGFALLLANMGYSVFAVTFAHNQGDNFLQAEQIANAIRRIRILLNRTNDKAFKVDVVAHSKGNAAVQVYVCNGPKMFPKKTYLTPFRHDVRRYVAIASAFHGIDIPYRYYMYNLFVAQKGNINSPMAADALVFYGFWKQFPECSVIPGKTNYFPGQCQLLYNLAKSDVPLGPESYTASDMNLTMTVLYGGGSSLFLKSRGIEAGINAGERLIYKLNEQGLEPDVQLAVIAGKNRYIANYIPGYGYWPMPWEIISPPGDGVVFLKSATAVDGMLRRGAKLLGQEIVDLNHLGVAFRTPAFEALDRFLMCPDGAARR